MTPKPEKSGFAAIRSALENRNYRYYATGNVLSHFGSWIQRVAIGWLAWELTHEGYWLGLIGFAELAPAMVLAPLAGAVADRVNRLKGIQWTQSLAMLQAVALAALAYGGLITIWWLFALSALRGVIMAFNQPLRFAILPSLVEKKDLSSAIGINSLSFNSARVLGPVGAAWIIAQWGAATAFAVNAVTFLIFIVTLFAVKIELPPRRAPKPISNMPVEILEGIRYCMRTPGIAQMFVLLSVVAMFGRAFVELLPGFADAVFAMDAQGLGILHSAIGVGAILASILLARRGSVIGLTRIVAWTLLVLGGGLLGFTATTHFVFAVACAGLIGFAMVIVGVGEQQLLQTAVSGDVRGRVMSLYGMISRGGPALGALTMGTASSFIGLRWPVAIGGILILVLFVWAIRRAGTMAEALEHEAGEERAGYGKN